MLVDSGSSLVSIFCPVDKVVVFFTKVLMTEASMNQRSLTRYATPSSGDTPKAELADNVVGDVERQCEAAPFAHTCKPLDARAEARCERGKKLRFRKLDELFCAVRSRRPHQAVMIAFR